MKTPMEIVSDYQRRVELMREQKTPHKDIQPLTINDIILFRALIHPTDKKESKDMTRELIKFVCDQGITTAEDIFNTYGWSDKPVMKRLKLLREFGMVRRESKKYYLPTPRLIELRNKYIERVCG